MTFERVRTQRRGIAMALLVVAAAVTVAWGATRDVSAPTASADHQHGAGATVGEAAPVQLDAAAAARIGVTYAVAERGTLERELRSVGQVGVDETRVRSISLKFDGWIERLYVDFTGRRVRAGEPLLVTYAPMLASAQEELVLAARLVTELAAADSATRLGAERLLAAARARLRNWDVPAAEVARIEASGEGRRTLELLAPVDGVVLEKFVVEGQRVMAGDPLLRVADLSRVWVEGEVFEQDVAMVRTGQPARVELEAYPGEAWTGTIVFLQPVVDREARTLRVRVELDNRDGRLRPGMYATLRIQAAAASAAIHVPRGAVLSTGQRDIVFVRRADGVLEPRAVQLGIITDERAEIRTGLAAGETVVASATFLVDAESNLGSALGAMPAAPAASPAASPAATPAPQAAHQH